MIEVIDLASKTLMELLAAIIKVEPQIFLNSRKLLSSEYERVFKLVWTRIRRFGKRQRPKEVLRTLYFGPVGLLGHAYRTEGCLNFAIPAFVRITEKDPPPPAGFPLARE